MGAGKSTYRSCATCAIGGAPSGGADMAGRRLRVDSESYYPHKVPEIGLYVLYPGRAGGAL